MLNILATIATIVAVGASVTAGLLLIADCWTFHAKLNRKMKP